MNANNLYQKKWNAKELINSVCQFMALFGNEYQLDREASIFSTKEENEERPMKRILRKRIDAVMSAYNRVPLEYSSIPSSELVSKCCPEDNIKQIHRLLSDTLLPNDIGNMNIELILKDYIYRCHIFERILEYKSAIIRQSQYWSNIYECSCDNFIAIKFTERLFNEKLEELNKRLDVILLLLLGEGYDKEFTEMELIEKYDYPSITDTELKELDLEWEFS